MEPTLRKGTTPSSVLQRMLTLKLKMGTESDLGGLYRYFVENLGGNDEFLRLGVETRRPQIVQRVTEIAGSIFQERALSLQRSRMVRIVEGRFTHGSLIFQEQVATFRSIGCRKMAGSSERWVAWLPLTGVCRRVCGGLAATILHWRDGAE